MQTVLVAGATGILGREVARLLHEEGHRVKLTVKPWLTRRQQQ
jgi:uncharacterized protein YbjT (DUF2867 family)